MSMSTPRVISAPTPSTPSFSNPVRVADLVHRDAVVHAVADGLVREAVELRADLADLADDDLFVAAAPVGLRRHLRALGVELESARPENGMFR